MGEGRLRELPFVTNLAFFDGDSKATLVFTETLHGEYNIILDSNPHDRTFSLRAIFSKFRECGFLISTYTGSSLARILLFSLLS